MSNKGNHHTTLAKRKIGIANKKDRAKIDKGIEDYINRLTKAQFPSLTAAANYAGISEKRLILYEMSTEDDSKIRLLLDEVRDRQKTKLIENGLNRKYDSRITGMLLQAHHGLKPENPNLTQTNIFNVSPDILADALALSKKK